MSRTRNLFGSWAFRAGVAMGLTFMPKVAAADVKAAVDTVKKKDKVIDAIVPLEKMFKKQKNKNMTVGATAFSKEAKDFMKAVDGYLASFGVTLKGTGPDKIKSLNEYLGVKVDGKTPNYVSPSTLESLDGKMVELNATLQDSAVEGAAAELAGKEPTVVFEKPKPAEVVPAPVEKPEVEEKEMSPIFKKLLERVDSAIAACDEYSLPAKTKAKLETYREQILKKHEEGATLTSKFMKEVDGFLKAVDMKVKVEKKKQPEVIEEELVVEAVPEVTVAEAEKAAKEKAAAEKAAVALASDLQKSSDYMSLLVFVTDPDKPLIFKKLFSGKVPNKLLKQLSKYHKKLESGQELTQKEKKNMEKTFGQTEKWIVSTLIPALDKYSSLLVGEPKKVYEEKMKEIKKNLETKEVKKGKKKTVKVMTIKDMQAPAILDILAPAESEQQKFSPLYIVANEYYLIEETLYFVKKRSSQLTTKALKKQDKDTWKQLKSINKQASKLYTQLGSKKGPGDINFTMVAPLLFEFEVLGRKANMELLEAEKDSVVSKNPIPSSTNALIDQIVQLRLARVEVAQNKQSPVLDEAKEALTGAIQLAKDSGMDAIQEFKIFFEDEPREVPIMAIAQNLLATEKDPVRLYEAAQSLLAIAEAQIWINNSSSLGWVHNTDKELKGAEESLNLALLTFEWNFGKEEPLTSDISISRRFAYNTMHTVAPLMLEYEKYLFAENQQANESMIKDGVETAVVLKDKKESDIKLMAPYFLKQPQLFGPGVGRGIETPYVALETEESINPSGNGIVVGELERQEDWLNGLKKGKYDDTYNKLVELSLEYGNIARGIQQEYESALQFLTAISALKEKELSEKVDEVKIIEAQESVSKVNIPLEEFKKIVKEYKEKLAEEKADYKYNVDFLNKKSTHKYMKDNPTKADEWKAKMEVWENQIKAADAFVKAAEAYLKTAKGLEMVTVGIDPEIFNAVKWIDANVDQYDKILTIPQQIALVEAGLDAVVIPEEGGNPPLQPLMPDVDRFSVVEGIFPLLPQMLAIQSTQPEMNFNMVYSSTDIGIGVVDEIAGNAEFLYGGPDKAHEVLKELAEGYGVVLSTNPKKSNVKKAANSILELLPDSLLGVDADKQSVYQTYKTMIEEAANTGSPATLRAAIEGLLADENIGGGLDSAVHIFHLNAKKNSILYQPMTAEVDMWFIVNKEAMKAIQQDERIKFTTLGVFLKLAMPYLNYPGTFEEFLLEKTEEGIEQVPTGEAYPATVKEIGGEATLGVAATTGKAVFTIRVKGSVTHQAVEGKVPTAYDEATGEPTEWETKTQSGTFFSLDFIDASVTLPNGKVFKGLGIAFLTPVAGEVKKKGDLDVPTYSFSPMIYSTFGWNAQNDKLSGGIYVQPGVALYGNGVDAFKDPSKIVWFTALQGNLLIKIPEKDQALNINAGVSATGNPLEGKKVGIEMKTGFEYYIKAGDMVIAPGVEVGGDPVNKQWSIVGGVKLVIPTKKK